MDIDEITRAVKVFCPLFEGFLTTTNEGVERRVLLFDGEATDEQRKEAREYIERYLDKTADNFLIGLFLK